MTTIELDDETMALLRRLAEQEHRDAGQVVKSALEEHANAQRPKPVLLTEYAGALANSPSFQGDPLKIQQSMRDEWA